MNADIEVTPADGCYRVDVHQGSKTTTHVVAVPTDLVVDVGWERAGDEALVRASFAFLLEREPAGSILRRFSLDVIGDYFPEYRAEIRRRLPGSP
jgi:hypothetical protein